MGGGIEKALETLAIIVFLRLYKFGLVDDEAFSIAVGRLLIDEEPFQRL